VHRIYSGGAAVRHNLVCFTNNSTRGDDLLLSTKLADLPEVFRSSSWMPRGETGGSEGVPPKGSGCHG
jgi:hypothetical protein